jgi:hypothetical protein
MLIPEVADKRQLLREERKSYACSEFSQFDLNVWSGRVSQEVFVELAVGGRASIYPAFDWSVMLLAIVDISAPAISLADRPRTGHSGHQCSHAPGRPILHLVSSSRRPRQVRVLGYVIGLSSSQARRSGGSDVGDRPRLEGTAPGKNTPAMRASLLASAIARMLWCSRFLAASSQGLSP